MTTHHMSCVLNYKEVKIAAIRLGDFDYNGPYAWWQPWDGEGNFKIVAEIMQGTQQLVQVEYDSTRTTGWLWWKKTTPIRHKEWFKWPQDFRYHAN